MKVKRVKIEYCAIMFCTCDQGHGFSLVKEIVWIPGVQLYWPADREGSCFRSFRSVASKQDDSNQKCKEKTH